MSRTGEDAALFGRSGQVIDDRPLVSFLYELMRDHVSPGVLERLVRDSPGIDTTFTNGHLARYAQDMASRLLEKPKEKS